MCRNIGDVESPGQASVGDSGGDHSAEYLGPRGLTGWGISDGDSGGAKGGHHDWEDRLSIYKWHT